MIIYTIVFLLLVAGGSAIPFEDCGSLYDLREVLIEECPRAPCALNPGQYMNVTTHYYPSFTSERLENYAYFFISNIEIDAVVNKHTCQTSNSSCVVVNGELKEYVAEFFVGFDLPPATGQLVWRVYNDDNLTVMCFKIPVRVNLSARRTRT